MEEFVNVLNEEDLENVAGGAATARKHVKIVKSTNICSSASSASDDNIIGHASPGDSYVFYGWTGNWAAIQFGARKAYVFKDSVMIF